MVRYDLQENKKKQSILRKEKQEEIEKNKSDLVTKIADLEKDRVKLQAELDFKVSKLVFDGIVEYNWYSIYWYRILVLWKTDNR